MLNNKPVACDIHKCLAITLATISIIKFDIFGTIGLIAYGVLIFYTAFCVFINSKKNGLCYTLTLYSGSAYYILFLILTAYKGGFAKIGTSLIQLFLIMLLSLIIREEKEIRKDIITLGKILTVAGFVMGVASVALSISFTYNPIFINNWPKLSRLAATLPYQRIPGFTGNANITACYCLVGSTFSTYLLTNENKKKWKIFSVINIFLAAYIIFFATASRTSMICFILFNFIYLSLFIIYKNKIQGTASNITRYFIIFFATCTILLIILFSIPVIRDYILYEIIRIDSLKTGSGRISIYSTALKMAEGHRLFGISINDFIAATGVRTHNMILEVLTFAGIIGLLPFLCYIISSFVYAVINLVRYNQSKDFSAILLRIFFIAYIISYFTFGITESAEVDGIQSISAIAQIIFGYSSVLFFNSEKIH